jgi:hypothetical protein
MLKLSKDKAKVKRRIPFKRETIDSNQVDKCTIYVEKYPESCNHE